MMAEELILLIFALHGIACLKPAKNLATNHSFQWQRFTRVWGLMENVSLLERSFAGGRYWFLKDITQPKCS